MVDFTIWWTILEKRRLHQMEQNNHDQEFELLKKKSIAENRTIMNLKDKLQESREQILENHKNRDKLVRLYELGVIDSNGDYIFKRNYDLIDEEEKEWITKFFR